jgi:hypothetical protein
MRRIGLVVTALALAGCSSGSGGAPSDQIGRQEVKQFVCPSAANVSAALGRTTPPPRQSSFKDLTAFCAYNGTTAASDGQLMVSVTFGTTAAELPALVKSVYPGRTATPEPGVGSAAYFIAAKGDDGAAFTFQSRDATFSLIGASTDTARNLAKAAALFVVK